jgi:hypothetical protein
LKGRGDLNPTKLSKEQFVNKAKADLRARKKHSNYDVAGYQCEARRRMKNRYRGTNLRTRGDIQLNN